MDGETREIPVFDVDLDEDPLLRWRSIATARELGDQITPRDITTSF